MMSAAEYGWFWHGRPFWIAGTILGFVFWWPIGLAMLLFGCAAHKMARRAWYGGYGPMPGRWHNMMGGGCGWSGRGRWGAGRPSGNQAFDDYRAETLRRLEEEQREFVEYLERLRRAKDKAEFDQFMADRRRGRPAGSPAGNPPGETV